MENQEEVKGGDVQMRDEEQEESQVDKYSDIKEAMPFNFG